MPTVLEKECFAIRPQVREVPGHVVTHVHAAELRNTEVSGQVTCLLVIHMLGYMEMRREECIDEEEVHSPE